MRMGLICDICSRKNWPCDGTARCSSCIKYNFDCSNESHVTQVPTPSTDPEVRALRERMEKMEGLINQLLSAQKPSPEPQEKPLPKHVKPSSMMCPNFPEDLHPSAVTTRAVREHMNKGREIFQQGDDDGEIVHLVNTMRRMLHPTQALMYFGKSSRLSTMHDVYVFREHNMRVDDSESGNNERQKIMANFCNLRPEHWEKPEWQKYDIQPSELFYTFPDPDLLNHLVELYFHHVNAYLPLLHRPSFETLVASGSQFTDDKVARLVLLVAACGAQWSDDPRTLVDGTDASPSRGWKWFKQVRLMHQESSFEIPHTQDLQMYSLAAHFLMSSSDELTGWMILGIGLKLAQSVGAHRRLPAVVTKGPTVEEELAKRAIWVLSVLDRIYSTVLGRPPNIATDEMDIDPLIDCDDEHWGVDWTQPEGTPSLISFFNSFIDMMHLLALSLRAIYPSKRSKIMMGLGNKDWDQHIVAELDSALNRWLDQIPEHLRWDPHMENQVFLGQSAVLYSFYYFVQQTVHRPFIPRPGDPPKLTFPSLAICTNAARCSAHVLEIYRKKAGVAPVFSEFFATSSTTLLLLNNWSGKSNGLTKGLEDVRKCLNIIHSTIDRSYPAARYLDLFIQLLPDLKDTFGGSGQKRTRDGDSPASQHSASSGSSTCYSSSDEVPSRRIIASNRRIHDQQQQHQQQQTQQPLLPTYTEELGQGFPMMFDPTFVPLQAPDEDFATIFQSYEDLGTMHAPLGWDGSPESADWETLLASVTPEVSG